MNYYGMYRGEVVFNKYSDSKQDDDPSKQDARLKGRCKIWVPGVYPEKYYKENKYLPWAEPSYPFFGGAVGTGINSVPAVGAFVWVFFEEGDETFPVFFGAMQGGDNWVSEHVKQHVIKTENVEVRIDDNPAKSQTMKEIPIVAGGTGTLSASVQLKVTGNVNILIEGDANVKVTGKTYVEYGSDVKEKITGNYVREITGELTESASKFNYTGETEITGETKITGATEIIGDTDVTGTVDATVDVIGGGISLKGHTHKLTTTAGAPNSEHTGNTAAPTP